MEPEGSLPCSQKSSTGPYPENRTSQDRFCSMYVIWLSIKGLHVINYWSISSLFIWCLFCNFMGFLAFFCDLFYEVIHIWTTQHRMEGWLENYKLKIIWEETIVEEFGWSE
jgi:hypothetical protein